MAGSTPWRLAEADIAYVHGSSDAHEGWSDFAFGPTTELPSANHCNANGCVRAESGAMVIPRGMRIALEIGLVPPASCVQDLCATGGAAVGHARRELLLVANATGDASCALGACVEPYNPLRQVFGPNFRPLEQVNRTLREHEGGEHLSNLLSGFVLPRSSWHAASISSDSRLEIRLA